MESVDCGSHVSVIPSQNGCLCTTRNSASDPADNMQPNAPSVWDQGCLLPEGPAPYGGLITLYVPQFPSVPCNCPICYITNSLLCGLAKSCSGKDLTLRRVEYTQATNLPVEFTQATSMHLKNNKHISNTRIQF